MIRREFDKYRSPGKRTPRGRLSRILVVVNATWRRVVALGLVYAMLGCSQKVTDDPADGMSLYITGDASCDIRAGDEAWLAAAPAAWSLVERDALGLEPGDAKPQFVLFDEVCSYGSADGKRWHAALHDGEVTLPDGAVLPPVVASFAAPGPGGTPFMAMALPSVWRAQGVSSELGLEKMLFAVFVHEMAHTRQFGIYAPKLDDLTTLWALPEDLDDDAVQERFADQPDFAASVDRERELLYAALEGDEESARSRARQALNLIEARRARWYVGVDERYAELEDVFLTLEGVGNFAGYAWLVHAEGGAMPPEVAAAGMRRGGRRWSQDEGMAIFLVLQRLNPQWSGAAFGTAPRPALQLLEESVR